MNFIFLVIYVIFTNVIRTAMYVLLFEECLLISFLTPPPPIQHKSTCSFYRLSTISSYYPEYLISTIETENNQKIYVGNDSLALYWEGKRKYTTIWREVRCQECPWKKKMSWCKYDLACRSSGTDAIGERRTLICQGRWLLRFFGKEEITNWKMSRRKNLGKENDRYFTKKYFLYYSHYSAYLLCFFRIQYWF